MGQIEEPVAPLSISHNPNASLLQYDFSKMTMEEDVGKALRPRSSFAHQELHICCEAYTLLFDSPSHDQVRISFNEYMQCSSKTLSASSKSKERVPYLPDEKEVLACPSDTPLLVKVMELGMCVVILLDSHSSSSSVS
jgi:hypothetical protein